MLLKYLFIHSIGQNDETYPVMLYVNRPCSLLPLIFVMFLSLHFLIVLNQVPENTRFDAPEKRAGSFLLKQSKKGITDACRDQIIKHLPSWLVIKSRGYCFIITFLLTLKNCD